MGNGLSVDNKNEVDPFDEATSPELTREDLSRMTTEELLELDKKATERILNRKSGRVPLAHHDFGGRGSYTSY